MADCLLSPRQGDAAGQRARSWMLRGAKTHGCGGEAVKRILSLCDFSGAWSQPYADAGYEVIRVDLQHGQDVRLLKRMDNIHGILAAPPCTCFCLAGNRYHAKRSKEEFLEAHSVVDACIRIVYACKPKWWALENPAGTLKQFLGDPAMRFNPCDYGDPYTKKTCLWGNFTPPVPILLGEDRRVKPTEGSKMHTQYGGKSQATKNARSKTPAGFAKAFFEVNP